jgi:protein-tyrosine-phosphatase
MDNKRFNVLFLGKRNAVRSIMAEGLMNHLCASRFRAFSAGTRPAGTIHPQAIKALQHWGIPTDTLRSKSVAELLAAGVPPLDFVITVCDRSVGESHPQWPGQPVTAHWDVPDPVAAEGDDEHRSSWAFLDVAVQLRRHIELLQALPLESLDRMSLLHEISQGGYTATTP